MADIDDVVKSSVGGMSVASTIEGRERYPINIRYQQHFRQDVQAISHLPMIAPSGEHILLGDVADVYIDNGPAAIKSENAQLMGWVLVDTDQSDIGSFTRLLKETVDAKFSLPAGYRLSWSGQYEYMQRAQDRLSLLIPIMLMMIFMLLYLNFKKVSEVIIIMGTVPMSLIGGVWLMYFLDYNFSVAVGVGFIALAGVAVETGMVLLAYLNEAYDHHVKLGGVVDMTRVIEEGAVRRIRPIMMAIAATFAGLVPVLLSTGTGSEVMRRIAAPMVGGLLSATILTLIIIPALFLLLRQPKSN